MMKKVIFSEKIGNSYSDCATPYQSIGENVIFFILCPSVWQLILYSAIYYSVTYLFIKHRPAMS